MACGLATTHLPSSKLEMRLFPTTAATTQLSLGSCGLLDGPALPANERSRGVLNAGLSLAKSRIGSTSNYCTTVWIFKLLRNSSKCPHSPYNVVSDDSDCGSDQNAAKAIKQTRQQEKLREKRRGRCSAKEQDFHKRKHKAFVRGQRFVKQL